MTIKTFTLNPESILSVESLQAIQGGENIIAVTKPTKPSLPEPPIIISPCDNA